MNMNQDKEIKVFVPAQALEHEWNSETASRADKIRCAVLRYHLTGDFFESAVAPKPAPYVYLQNYIFHPGALGYEVSAFIRCG